MVKLPITINDQNSKHKTVRPSYLGKLKDHTLVRVITTKYS